MMTYHACSNCNAPVRRSRRRNIMEFLIAPVLLPFRCTICDRRELKLRFIDMTPPGDGEGDELELPEGDELVMPKLPMELIDADRLATEEVEKAEAKMAEAKTKLSEAKTKAEAARKKLDEARTKAREKAEADLAARKAAAEKKQAEAAAEAKPVDDRKTDKKKIAGSKKPDPKRPEVKKAGSPKPESVKPKPKPVETPVTPQSHTWDEEEEQIYPS